MPKRNNSKKMRGGWDWPWGKKEENAYDSSNPDGSSASGWFDSLKQSASSATGTASSWFSSSATPTTSPTSTPMPTTTPTQSSSITGGKKRRHKSRRMRGGYSDNVSLTNLASRAASFSGSTARAQAYVGGKRTKRRHHKKSHRRK